MFRQTLYLISKSFYQWIHPSYEQNTKISIEFLVLVIFKAQEMAIVFDKNITRNPEMKLLAGFSKLSFVSEQDSFYYFTILICIFFIIHVSFTLLITLNILKKQLANYLFSYTILHFYLTYYSYIIYIPVLYSSLKIFHELRKCSKEEFCNNQNSFFLLFIGIYNIISCITMKIIHILYARASSIMGDSNILQLQTPIYQNLIQEILVFISIFFFNYNQNNLIGLILICIKQSLSIINQLDKINCQFYVLFKVFSICTIISIYFVLETCEYFLITLFCISVMKIILERIKFQNIFDSNSESLIKIQIIENSIINQNHFLQILLLKMHNCQQCYKPQQMSGCIFKKLLLKNNDLEQQLLYCQYISECYPLKALIKILSVESDDIYFNGAKLNLIEILTLQSKRILKENQNVQKKLKYDEYSDKLNLNLVFEGLPNLYILLDKAIILAKKMIECQNLIKTKFNQDSRKLKNYNVKEVSSIRILQIFYSVIYNNQYISNLFEKDIEDILKNERTADIDPLSCTQIIQNKIFIFQSSLVKNRGQLINLNTAKLAKFFDQTEDQVMQIYHCEQIMPDFIGEIHDTLINRYIKKGFTILQVQSQQTFLKNIEGYLEQCVINLMSYYDIKNNDFIMNALISKIQSQESIIFGVDGVILGCTQTFFQQVIKSNYQYIKDSLKNLNENHNNLVQSFFEQSPLIQLFIPNIIQQIEELQQQYLRVKQSFLTNQKSSWIFINDYANICKKSLQNLRRFKSKNNKQFQNKDSNEDYLDEQVYYEKNENLTINNIPITLLQPYLKNQFIQDLTYEQLSNSQAFELYYDITFNSYNNSNNQLGYFVMNLKDIKSLDFQKINKQNQIYQIFSPPKEKIEQSQNNLQNCQSNSQDFGKEFKTQNDFIYNTQQQNDYIQSLSALSENQKQLNQVKSSDTIANLETFRGGQITNNQIECNLLNVDKNYIDSQVISEQLITNQRYEQQYQKNLNHSKNVQAYLLERIQSHKQLREEENNDFKSNPSKSSVSSSQREIQILVEQLYSKQQLITPLKRIYLILIIAFIIIYLSIILNYSVTVMLLHKQTNGVLELIQPQNITYFYSSIFYQLWSIELDTEGIVPLSEFQRVRNIQSVQSMYDNARIYMKKLNINIPLFSQNQGINEYIVRNVINDELQIKSIPIETFYYMIYEISEFQFRDNLDAIEPCYDELHTHGFLRQNIVYLTQQISDLVDNINDKTISDQEQALPVFQSYLAIEISIVIIVFFLQLKYWLLFDKIQKRILLLISTLNEFQSQEQIYKLQQVKYFLNNNNYSNWKVINFCEIMNGNVSKKTIQLSLTESLKKGQNSDSSLQNRIQKTQFKTKLNYMFMILLGLSYGIYLIISYIIYIQQFNNFQPSLIATLKYGQFRTKMDITSFIGGFIKTEALLLENNISQINQTEVIELFKQNKDSLLQLIHEVSQAILENAYKDDKISRFDDFLHGDICELRPWETLKACDLTRQHLSYSSKDNLKYLLSQGILGYTAAFVKYLNSDFDYEIEHNRYNTYQQNSFEVLSQQFENFFLSYFCEIQDTFLEFLNLFKIDNQEIADAIIYVLELYYLLFGTIYLIVIFCLSTFLIFKQQQKIMFLRQILALIPCELIQNPNMKTRTKLIYAWLY